MFWKIWKIYTNEFNYKQSCQFILCTAKKWVDVSVSFGLGCHCLLFFKKITRFSFITFWASWVGSLKISCRHISRRRKWEIYFTVCVQYMYNSNDITGWCRKGWGRDEQHNPQPISQLIFQCCYINGRFCNHCTQKRLCSCMLFFT